MSGVDASCCVERYCSVGGEGREDVNCPGDIARGLVMPPSDDTITLLSSS